MDRQTEHSPGASRWPLWLVVAVSLLAASVTHGRDEPVARRIPYQGQLQGATGSTDVVFRIFNGSGVVVWGPEAHQVTPDAEGRFAAVIGTTGLDLCRRVGETLTCDGSDGVADLDQIDASDAELEVSIDGVALSPRQKLFAAFQSAKAASLEDSVMLRLVPTGVVFPFAGPEGSTPAGWKPCDGSELDATQYPGLFGVIGIAHGGAAGTFRLPDYRGRHLRGVSGAIGTDRDSEATSRLEMNTGGSTGNLVGSVQDDAFQTHWHRGGSWHTHGPGGVTAGNTLSASPALPYPNDAGRAETPMSPLDGSPPIRTASETRVDNAYVNFIIRCGLQDPC